MGEWVCDNKQAIAAAAPFEHKWNEKKSKQIIEKFSLSFALQRGNYYTMNKCGKEEEVQVEVVPAERQTSGVKRGRSHVLHREVSFLPFYC